MADTIRCLACGFENKPDHSYCGECGSQIQKQCEACGALMDLHYKVCGSCGAAFEILEPALQAEATPQEEPEPDMEPALQAKVTPQEEPAPDMEPALQAEATPQEEPEPDMEPAVAPLPKPSVEERQAIARVKAVIVTALLSIGLFALFWIQVSNTELADELSTVTLTWLTLGAIMTGITLTFGAFRPYVDKGEAIAKAAKELVAFVPGVWRDLDKWERLAVVVFTILGTALLGLVISLSGAGSIFEDPVAVVIGLLVGLTLAAWGAGYAFRLPQVRDWVIDPVRGVLRATVGFLVGGLIAYALALLFTAIGSPRYFEHAVFDLGNFLLLGPPVAAPALMLGTALLFEYFDRRLVELRYWDYTCQQAGACAYETGDYEQAIVYCTQALEENPGNEMALWYRARSHHHCKQYDLAAKDYGRLVEWQPRDKELLAKTYSARGDACRMQGNLGAAIADYDRALGLKPNYERVLANRGNTCRQMGRYDDALADLTRALAFKPDSERVLASRGVTYRQMKRYDEALTDLTRALELMPDYEQAVVNRGITYRLMKRYDEALADLTRALELKPDYEQALAHRGITYRRMERYQEALADLTLALELNPDDAWACYWMACVFALMGQATDAFVWLEKSVQIDGHYRQFAQKNTDFDGMRSEPAFQVLVNPPE